VAKQTKLIMTSRDFDRLEVLLESLSPQQFPGKNALQAELSRAQIVDPGDVPHDVVTMNSLVRFRLEESGEEFRLRLVYPKDGEGEDRISILAPVGSALLGLSVGDELQWPMPHGRVSTVKVVEVMHQPERTSAVRDSRTG
jgi:regulator of nucleoside diphosphate kinase